MKKYKRIFTIVPDSQKYGDLGMNTFSYLGASKGTGYPESADAGTWNSVWCDEGTHEGISYGLKRSQCGKGHDDRSLGDDGTPINLPAGQKSEGIWKGTGGI